MKILYIVIYQIKNLLRHNTFLVIILIIGIIACDLMFFFGYGLYRQFILTSGIPDYYAVNNGEKVSSEKIIERVGGFSPDIRIDLYARPEIIYDGINISGGMLYASNKSKKYSYRGNSDTLSLGTNVMIPDKIYKDGVEEIVINGISYNVIGTFINDSQYIVSLETFIKSGLDPDYLTLFVYDRGSGLGKLQNLLPEYTVTYSPDQMLEKDSKNNLLFVYFVFFVCLVTYLFFWIYFYESMRYEYSVYELVGCSKMKSAEIFSYVMLTVLAVSYFLSVLIHRLLYRSLFSLLITKAEIIYEMKDYILIFLLSVVAVYLVLLIWILIKTERSAIANLHSS